MMSRPAYALLATVLVTYPGAARSGPTSYDECITDTMKGVSSDVAARAIIESCRNLFPADPEGVVPAAAVPAAATQAPPPQDRVTPAPPATEAGTASATRGKGGSGAIRELTKDELDKLEYRGFFFGTSYRVNVINGNENLTLKELTIAVWDKDNIDELKTYRDEIHIPPLEEGSARYSVVYKGEEETWDWNVVGAKGAE